MSSGKGTLSPSYDIDHRQRGRRTPPMMTTMKNKPSLFSSVAYPTWTAKEENKRLWRASPTFCGCTSQSEALPKTDVLTVQVRARQAPIHQGRRPLVPEIDRVFCCGLAGTAVFMTRPTKLGLQTYACSVHHIIQNGMERQTSNKRNFQEKAEGKKKGKKAHGKVCKSPPGRYEARGTAWGRLPSWKNRNIKTKNVLIFFFALRLIFY